KPRRPSGHRSNKGEHSPEENQHACRKHNFLRCGKTHVIRYFQQCEIKQNIVPLLCQVQSRRLPLLNQLRQPRVIDMARQITCLNPLVPEAWNQKHNGQKKNAQLEQTHDRKYTRGWSATLYHSHLEYTKSSAWTAGRFYYRSAPILLRIR